MEQDIRFCTTPDGVRIAYASSGKGDPPLVRVIGWFMHLVSNVVRELAMGKRFLFSDVGDVALKGVEDPVRLFEVRQDQA